ncbi:aminoacyl-tRNA hydrolase [Candidatus Microgenomates bacterium]|nr:aminoacyl-tRNA hydrolase [Candidatus Microgenomates bacterium]
MKLIVGLGNPGKQYAQTRHNLGWLVLDQIAGSATAFHERSKFRAAVAETGQSILAKPQTFMNSSGGAAKRLLDFYKLTPPDLLVVHDDVDLPFGTIRVRQGGGAAGHRGVASVVDMVGKDFYRVRIGIANEHSPQTETDDFVLAEFSKEEQTQLPGLLEAAAQVINEYVTGGSLPERTLRPGVDDPPAK